MGSIREVTQTPEFAWCADEKVRALVAIFFALVAWTRSAVHGRRQPSRAGFSRNSTGPKPWHVTTLWRDG
jgi:hypothetical protein